MTSTQTPCTPEADRFLRSVAVPDPPSSPADRRRYWDDTVMEALGELRRRLASSREGISTQALLAIVDLEKHKMRHGRPVSGTHVPYLGELDEDARSPILQNRAEPPSPEAGTEGPQPHGPILENQATLNAYSIPDCFDDTPRDPWDIPGPAPQVSTPAPQIVAGREAGATPAELPSPSPGEPPSRLTLPSRAEPREQPGPTRESQAPRAATPPPDPAPTAPKPLAEGLIPHAVGADPTDPAYLARVARDREECIARTGMYAEDMFPGHPLFERFKSEPRPHPAERRWRMRLAGLDPDATPDPPPDNTG